MRRPGILFLLLAALGLPGAPGSPGAAAAQARAQPPSAPPVTAQEQDSLIILGWVQEQMTEYVYTAYRGGTHRARLVEEGRPDAMAALDFGAAALPGDDWVTGHRIGLHIKTGELDRALELAQACRAADWWCAALLGFVQHERGEVEASERAFDEALSRMPEETRCAWVSEVSAFERHLGAWTQSRSEACEEHAETSRTLWWLSNPLFMEPGNDRRTEHFSRLVQLQFHDETLQLHGAFCHPAHRWSVIVFGFPPTRWSYAAPFDPFDRGPGMRFVPGRDLVADPFASREEDWLLRAREPEERYAVPRWSVLHPLPAQVALFRRPGGLHVAASSELRGHPLEGAAGLRTAIALSEGPDVPPTVLPFPEPGVPGLFATSLAPAPLLLSMEAVGDEDEAGRSRWGHELAPAAPGGLALSDPLLFAWEEGVEETLEAVVPRMLGTSAVRAEAELGVFWEIYGVGPEEEVDLSLSAIPDSPGFLRRLGQALRILDRPSTMAFTWREAPGEEAVAGRALRLDLSRLEPGRYTFQVNARNGQGEEVTASRRLEILGGGDG